MDICGTSSILRVIYIFKILFIICSIVVPIIIMLNFVVGMSKVVTSSDSQKSFKDELILCLKRCTAAFIFFIIPTFINGILGLVYPTSSFKECYDNASLANIKSLAEKEEAEYQDSLDKEKEELYEGIEKADEESQNDQDSLIEVEGSTNPRNSGNNSSGSGSGSGSSLSNFPKGTITIHVGDSRTVGLCAAITGSYSGCSYDSSGPKIYGNDIFIAQGSMAYSWFDSSAVPAVNNIIKNNPNNTYNIVSYMGVNWLLSDIDKYIPRYNQLATGDWSKQNIILVSVNPVNESVEAQSGYGTKNSSIEEFNSKLKNGVSGNNVSYCDSYSQTYSDIIKDNTYTKDGLHYTNDMYNRIYSIVNSCL